MILFVSDPHLQRTAWAAFDSLAGDALDSWNQVVEYAVHPHNDVSAVILGGDTLDLPLPSSGVVQAFKQGMDRLAKANRAVFYIQGQHCRSNPPWPSLFGGVHLHKTLHLIDGVRVYGLDNMSAENLKGELAGVPGETQILVMHQMLKGAPCVNWDLDLDDVTVPRLRHVLLGDLHVRWTAKIKQGKHIVQVLYNGSIAMQSIDEPMDKFFHLINTDDLDAPPVAVKLNTRSKIEASLESDNDVVDLDRELGRLKSSKPPLVVVRHRVGLPVSKLREAHPECVFMFRPEPLLAPMPVTATGASISLEKNLDLVVDRDKKPELHSLLLAALTAEDARAVIEASLLAGKDR